MERKPEVILRHVKPGRILDVGCAGHWVDPTSPHWLHGRLREAFPESDLVGIDLNRTHVKLIQALGYDSVHVMDASRMQFDGRFDTIVAGDVIEHLTDPAAFLRAAEAHLAPGGRIVVTTPYPFALHWVLRSLMSFPETCPNDEHTMWFCISTMRELASREGLQVQSWRMVRDYHLERRGRRRYWLWARLMTSVGRLLPARLGANLVLFVLTRLDP